MVFMGFMILNRLYMSSCDTLVLLSSGLMWVEEIAESLLMGRPTLPIQLILPATIIQASMVFSR